MIRFLLLMSILSLPALADNSLTVTSSKNQTPVVELYTSEGCSSCPPADEWFAALTDLQKSGMDLLPLAFHVDYWDYIGWKDRFASPKHTSRQRVLGANNRQSTIYTPEFFVDGKETRGTRTVVKAIQKNQRLPSLIELRLSVEKKSDLLHLKLDTDTPRMDGKSLHHRYFVYENNLITDVERGENAGETLSHHAVVRFMSNARSLESSNLINIPIDKSWKPENIGIAAIVTTAGNETYIQSVQLELSSLF